jgi:predicted CXXCH cytochrome family protein
MVSAGRALLLASTTLLLSFTWAARAHVGRPQLSAAPAAGATFVGAEACASCHQQNHETWKSGRHSKMVQPASAASVIGDFSKGTVTLRDGDYGLRRENGEYFITESFLSGKRQEHRVEYTLGSRRIQHYLTTIDKGRIVVLPPTWDVQRREWLHNRDIGTDRPDGPGVKPVQQWNFNCVGCHVSEQQNEFTPATGEYATRWKDFGTSCERCHGPGSAHVEKYTHTGASSPPASPLIVRPTRLDATKSSMICAQCHSLRNVIDPGYAAGEHFYDYFQPVLEYDPHAAEDSAYWADGRPRRFSNDAVGLWQSQCFLRGGATCTNCHLDPHLPDVDRNAQLGASSNALCTGCHKSIGASLTTHTRHTGTSRGSSCVECHMPKTVVSIRATMRDHTIGVPAPENTVKFGIPNACTECHADRTPAWASDVLAKWWPQGRRARLVARAEAFTAARARRPEALNRLVAIAADDEQPPLIRANALGHLRDYTGPAVTSTFVSAAKHDDPAVRVAAVVGLGRGTSGDTVARATLLAALNDPRRVVRISALVSLVNVGTGPLGPADEERFRRASREFATWAYLYREDAGLQRDLGVVQLMTGEYDLAAAAFEISAGLEPDRPSVRYLFALARLGQQRFDEARALLKLVPRSDPYYQQARERLKTLEPRE